MTDDIRVEVLGVLKHILDGSLSLPRFAEEQARSLIAKLEAALPQQPVIKPKVGCMGCEQAICDECAPIRQCGSNGTVDCQSTAAEQRCAVCPHGMAASPVSLPQQRDLNAPASPVDRKRLCRDCADLAEEGICPNDGKPCSSASPISIPQQKAECGSECNHLCQQPDGFGWCGKKEKGSPHA